VEVVITGGSGFIGTHLLLSLVNDSSVSKVHIIDIVFPKLESKKIVYYHTDICNEIKISINSDDIICYHLAAVAKEPGFEWEEYYANNYLGTKNVIEFCERNSINNIVFTSTMMIYKAKEYRFTENDLPTPDTAYGISKLLAEEKLLTWLNKNDERKLTIYRVGVVFGKGENGNYTRLFNALKKNYFFYIGKKNTIKSGIYVKDVINALIFTNKTQMKNIIYNLAIPFELKIEDIVNTIKKSFSFKGSTFIVPYKLALLGGYFFEILGLIGFKTNIHHRRIQKLFFSTNISSDRLVEDGFKFEYTFEEAISDWRTDCNNEGLF
jgi:nucleoside-diphosphate-sugar epimerase